MKAKGLNNLTSLFGQTSQSPKYNRITKIPLKDIVVKEQVRKEFTNIDELAKDIQDNGLLQPVTVYEHENEEGKYILLMGERRFRAVKSLGHDEINAQIRLKPKNQRELMLLQVAENLQREELKPIELAQQFKILRENGMSQTEIAAQIHKSDSYVSRILGLLDDLPNEIKELDERKKGLPVEAITNLKNAMKENPEEVKKVLKEILDEDKDLSVHQTRDILRQAKTEEKIELPKPGVSKAKEPKETKKNKTEKKPVVVAVDDVEVDAQDISFDPIKEDQRLLIEVAYKPEGEEQELEGYLMSKRLSFYAGYAWVKNKTTGIPEEVPFGNIRLANITKAES